MSIRDALAAGLGFRDLALIDAHAHVGRWGSFYMADPSLIQLVRELDRFNIELCCVTSLLAFSVDMPRGNDEVLEAIRFAPDRFLGYVSLVPHQPLADCRREVQRMLDASDRIIGLKFHPMWNNYPINGDLYQPLWELAAEFCPLVLVHCWLGGEEPEANNTPDKVAQMAARYPGVTVIMGHSGGSRAGQLQCAELCRRRPNLYMDLCGSEFGNLWIERLLEHAPADKVLFATDIPFLGAGSPAGRVGYAAIDDAIKRKILRVNMERILATCTRWGRDRFRSSTPLTRHGLTSTANQPALQMGTHHDNPDQ
ncbi:MAG: Amidohydrolase [candidate division BRC1 bacterium ADurb.BinA292]|nr:MAG: Amidohydrolase [candidate division BRC1 bacterium ADurb.BinA292]